jgi:hypothetical protein
MGMGSQLKNPEIKKMSDQTALHNLDLWVEFISSHGQSHGARPVNTSKYFLL